MRRAFLLSSLLLFCLPGLALLGGLLPSRALKGYATSGLTGVTVAAEAPTLSLQAVLDGSFQVKAGPWLAERMGRPRGTLIRINNGMAYLFGRSTVPSIMFGRDGALFERPYVEEWCGRPAPIDAGSLAATFSRLQQHLRRAGKGFVLVISPSKAATYPEWLLPGSCAGPFPPRRYDLLVAALREAGVTFVDGPALLRDAKQTQPWPVFSRAGTHWNQLGAALAASEIMAALREQLPARVGRVAAAKVEGGRVPVGDENDLALLLNLPFDLRICPCPVPRLTNLDPETSPRVLLVGTSFSWQLLRQLTGPALIGETRFYYYFSRVLSFRDGRPSGFGPSEEAPADLPGGLGKADAVVLELNEWDVTSPHATAFATAVLSLPVPD